MSKTKKEIPDNRKISGNKSKPKRDEKGRWVKGAPSPNPDGRPKDGESWSGIIREISEMTVEDVINLVGANNELGHQFSLMPRKVQMKKLITARVMAALMFEPTSRLWNSLMERAEGKIAESVDLTSNGGPVVIKVIRDEK